MKIKKLLSIVLLVFLTYINVEASSCSYKEQVELDSESAKIKVKYDVKTGYLDPSEYECQDEEDCAVDYDYFEISILNMSEKFYIEVTNNNTKEVQTFTYKDIKDGVISFDYDRAYEITNFTFRVFSSNETSCPRENYRVIYLTTPKVNPYYYYLQCQNNPDHYLCQKYITIDNVSFDTFQEQITEYENKKVVKEEEKEIEKNFLEKVFDFIDDNKYVIISVIAAAGISTIVIVILKRKRQK